MNNLLFPWIFLISLFQTLSGTNTVLVLGQCLDDQRSLLIQFNNTLSFDPSSSTKLVNWNQTGDCCQWKGIDCDDSGHVISLELYNESISGGIENSTTLFGFRYLEKLNLAYNRFNSVTIPNWIYNLANLTYLNLSNAGFVGQIPVEVSRMTRLVTLDLSTQFPGVEPLKLENPNLKMLVENLNELQQLYLDGVNISAPGSEWCAALASSLTNLSSLSLSNCQLSGPIDGSFSKLRSLSILRLDNNNLSTTIPSFFATFSKLTSLSLSFCSLQGFFPEEIINISTLQNLDLSNNRLLNGNLPEFPQGGSLRTIDLSYTNFSGFFSDSVENLRMLSRIDVSNCNFTGKLPSTSLTELIYLDLSFNNFTGFVPRFSMSKKLTYIDLSHNGLSGSLSSTHFEGLANLVFVNLGYNSLNGSIPSVLFGLPSLQKLQLSNNQFGGPLGESSSSSSTSPSQLDTIDLSSNRLEGMIPKFLFQLRKLNVLLLSSNFFNGTLQMRDIQNLQNLTRLELAHNYLSINASSGPTSSTFPQLTRLNLASCNLQRFPNLRNQSKMTFLDLSDNQIRGGIPNWIWEVGNRSLTYLNLSHNLLQHLEKPYKIPTLTVFDIHSNHIHGDLPIPPPSAIYIDYSANNFNSSIPDNIGDSILSFSFFSLSNNSLTGAIPESICNANYLQVLDLSNNSLSGKIPDCLLSSSTLGVLNLGRNNLTGNIPDIFSPDCVLRTLDLGRNNLSGRIPYSLQNCKLLEVVNIGNNEIEDKFPCMLKNTSSLRVLVLRSNRFSGDLRCYPGAKNSWQNLQIIDIAFNNFSGNLSPKCFLSWKGMMLNNDEKLDRSHLRFEFLKLNNFYYQDTVTVTVKGLELELVKILTVFTSIDFSSNIFYGEIPETIGNLSSLYILNMSHNALTGKIPKSIGKLTQLGSLDLSMNNLSGEIPEELTGLTFLSFLNLSHNMLSGRIPIGRQFQTFSNTSYEGKMGLCGFPLTKICEDDPLVATSVSTSFDFDWQFIFTGLGFGVGAAIVVAPLAFVKKWREKCDKNLDQVIKLIFPKYGFHYVRYDGKVAPAEKIEGETTDEDDDEEDEDEDEDEVEEKTLRGRYCVFCTKIDIHRKKAIHNPKCTCYYAPPVSYSSPTSTSPSCSLLLTYR